MPVTEKIGLRQDRLDHLVGVMRDDIARGRYYGGVICVARHGELALHAAVGHGYRNQQDAADDALGVQHLLRHEGDHECARAARGRARELALHHAGGRASFPEFAGGEREKLTIYHLMTHSTGIGPVFTPKPGMYIDRLDEIIAAICENVHATGPPGEKVNYSPMVAHALLGEMVRRVDPKQAPLSRARAAGDFRSAGDARFLRRRCGADLSERKIVPDFLRQLADRASGAQQPRARTARSRKRTRRCPGWASSLTANDLYRFAECLRRGGELDGARIIGPADPRAGHDQSHRRQAERAVHAARPEPRLGSRIRRTSASDFRCAATAICHHQFGTLTSPRTFGNHGAGSTLFWVDPERDMTFACLTAGRHGRGRQHRALPAPLGYRRVGGNLGARGRRAFADDELAWGVRSRGRWSARRSVP